jgi:hypothetical protein
MNDPTDTFTPQKPPEKAGDITATMKDARAAAQEQASAVKQTAKSALTDAQHAAAEKTTEVKDAAAGEIGRTADGLEAAASEMEGSPVQQDLLREAADGLRQISRSMEGKSIGEMVEGLSGFGRRNPLAYLGGAALAGFALARFARASAPEAEPARWEPSPPSGTPYQPTPTGTAFRDRPTTAPQTGAASDEYRPQTGTASDEYRATPAPAPGGFTNG